MKIKFKFNRIVECYVRPGGAGTKELVPGYSAIFLPENNNLCSGIEIWREGKPDGTLNEGTVFELTQLPDEVPSSQEEPGGVYGF